MLHSRREPIKSGEAGWKANDKVQQNGVHGEGCNGDRDIDESHSGGLETDGTSQPFDDVGRGDGERTRWDFSHGTQSGE